MADDTRGLLDLAHYQLGLMKRAQAKRAFVPAGGGAPPPGDPSMGGAPPPGAPPMDPAMMGGAPPPGMPMDPSMMGGAPPPMDPAAMGGAPTTGDPAAAAMAGDPSGGMPPPGLPPEMMQQIVDAVTAQMGGGGAAAGGAAGGAAGAMGKPGKLDPTLVLQRFDNLEQKVERALVGITEMLKNNNKTLSPDLLLAGTKHAPPDGGGGDGGGEGDGTGGAGGSQMPKLSQVSSRAADLAARLRPRK